MLHQALLLSLLIVYLSGSNHVEAGPLKPYEKEEAVSDSENGQSWTMCPSYGSFYGDVGKDPGCCLDENTCSESDHFALQDNHLPALLRTKRFKRSIRSGDRDVSRDMYQYNFDNLFTARSSGDPSPELMEISLCESKAEVIKPAFGTAYGTKKPVQIYQFEPFLVQWVRIDRCDEKPTAVLHGECRQRYEPQEMFIVSRNATDSEGIGIDRDFVAVPMGCSTFIDPTLFSDILNRQKQVNANRSKAIIKSTAGTSVNYPSYYLNNKPVPTDFRDMTIGDQPAQQSALEPEEEEESVKQTAHSRPQGQDPKGQKQTPGKLLAESGNGPAKGENTVQDPDLDLVNEETEEKAEDKKGRDSLEPDRGERVGGGAHSSEHSALGSQQQNTGKRGTDSDKGRDEGKRRSDEAPGNGKGTGNADPDNEPNRAGGVVQDAPNAIKVPVYFGSSALSDPVQQFLNSRNAAAAAENHE